MGFSALSAAADSTSRVRPMRAFAPAANVDRPHRVAGAKRLTFERQPFVESLDAALEPKVMGYTFLLQKNGRVVADGAGGLARNNEDGHLEMTTHTPQNLGSLFKFITGVALLHVLDRAPEGSAGGNNSYRTRLDAPAALLYPQIWNSAIKSPQIRTITLQQLLQHKSGFRDCSTPQTCFGGDYDATLQGQRAYLNFNFALSGYLLALYSKPDLIALFNKMSRDKTAQERDAEMQRTLGDVMMAYINNEVLSLAPGQPSASCDAANEYKNNGAYGYVGKLDRNPGIITSRKAGGKPCSGAGGNWMSISDFAAFVGAALHTDRILSLQARNSMYREPMDPDDRLVWSFTTMNNWIRDNFGMDTIIWSNGIQPYDAGQSFNTVLLRLPDSYELMIFTNSGGMSVNNLANAGMTAFRAGMEGNFK